jgi:hypothetical protein
MHKRVKTKAITMYVDPKYEDKLMYLKYTMGITAWIESCLEKVKIDEAKLKIIKDLQEMKKTAK